MGQPLTTLQAFRLLASTPSSDPAVDRRTHVDLAEQVDHLTDLYRALRLLLEVETDHSPSFETAPGQIINRLQPEWQHRALRRGVTLTLVWQNQPLVRLPISSERLFDLLFDATLSGILEAGHLQITVTHQPESLQLTVTGGSLPTSSPAPAWIVRVAIFLLEARGVRVALDAEPVRTQADCSEPARRPGTHLLPSHPMSIIKLRQHG